LNFEDHPFKLALHIAFFLPCLMTEFSGFISPVAVYFHSSRWAGTVG